MRLLATCLLLLASGFALGQHQENVPVKPGQRVEGLGDHHHPVSTKNPKAQKFFDQGLILLYAFNHDEAARSFARAAELDPNIAMAYWGLALAKGSNYNLEADEDQYKAALHYLVKALELAPKATKPEQDYIRALAKRYSENLKADREGLAKSYKNAMGALARKYPDDLDAATLYAESAMNLRPWKLWQNGKPAEGTQEILDVLESVLRRNPNHPGANHYYIHAIEASPFPERGLTCAQRLETLVPGAGHLVHMPAHLYMRVGDYAAAAKANERAIAADQAYFKAHQVKGVYPVMYYPHNIHFLAVAHCFQGRYADAKKAADQLTAHVEPHVKEMPMLEGFLTVQPMVLTRFERWQDIMTAKLPPEKQTLTRAVWHFARAHAWLALGFDQAMKEKDLFLACKKAIPDDAKISDINSAHSVLAIAEHVLEARFALANKEQAKAVAALRKAIEAEDALKYGEPTDWIIPVRETLGDVLLRGGQPAEAEKLFRAALEKNPRDGRCLLGLHQSLKLQNKDYAAQQIAQQFKAAWRNADTPLQGFVDQ